MATQVDPPGLAVEVTILIPCLDEAATIGTCVTKAGRWLVRSGVSGEVLVVDNGSEDQSVELAEAHGARVVTVERRGYGSAILGGVDAAYGTYVIVGDADDTYDFCELDRFLERLRAGDVLVVGNRFQGGIERGAMPWMHRHIGNPVLSALGRRFYGTPLGDFHCGLRAFERDTVAELGLNTTGMEFASELIVKTSLAGHRIGEVPTTLAVGGRERPPHLRTWSDGWRHLRFLLLYSPRWLFQIPGLAAFVVGGLLSLVLTLTDIRIADVRLSIGTLVYAATLTLLGWQSLVFGLFVQEYGARRGLLPHSSMSRHLQSHFRLEWGIIAGGVLILAGLVIAGASLLWWGWSDFADLDPVQHVRVVVASSLSMILGMSIVLSSFVWGFLQVEPTRPRARRSGG